MIENRREGSTPAVFEPPPGNPRFPLFDGLRAAAAVGVLLGHCAGASGIASTTLFGHAVGNLQMGVTVFFVISGFLLYRPFVASDMSGIERAGLLTFYRRRALRIFPGYWFALIAVSLLPGAISVFGPGWWRYFLLVQNYSGYQFTFARGIGPAWSISVEIAFYAVLPAVAFALRSLAGSSPRRRLTLDLSVLTIASVVSLLARAVLTNRINASSFFASPLDLTLILTLPFYIAWFAVGMAFASISAYSIHTQQRIRWIVVASRYPSALWALALALFAVLLFSTPALTIGEFPGHHVLVLLAAAVVVFPAAFPTPDGSGVPARLLGLRPVVWVGLVSYGVYLWSSPIEQALVHLGILGGSLPFFRLAIATFVLAVVAGAFSYYVVERPFLRLKYRPWPTKRAGTGD